MDLLPCLLKSDFLEKDLVCSFFTNLCGPNSVPGDAGTCSDILEVLFLLFVRCCAHISPMQASVPEIHHQTLFTTFNIVSPKS